MSNFIHIVINVLELVFQSHKSVGTEDFYQVRLSVMVGTFDVYNLIQYEVAKVADEL